MLARLRSSWWVLPAFVGIIMLWALSALWNFSHAYIMAGGSNPLVLLEGTWPDWSGTALAIGLASVGSDIVKAVSGFILVAVIVNKSLRWYARLGGAILALVLVIPTLLWSARSAVGMASMAFGDTIATRNTEKVISKSLSAGVESMSGRLGYLDGQTTCKGAQCSRNTKEAANLRQELKGYLKELKTTKQVGAGDPGGHVIADASGWPESKVTTWTIMLFIAMVEIASTLGLPALNLATKLHEEKAKDDDRPDKDAGLLDETRDTHAKTASVATIDDPAPFVEPARTPLVAARKHEREGSVLGADDSGPEQAEPAQDSETSEPSIATYLLKPRKQSGQRVVPFKSRDTRTHARMDDGHIEEFARTLSDLGNGSDLLPFRSSVFERYKVFCRDKNLRHMHDKALSNALSRFGIARHRPTGGSVYLRLPEDLEERIVASAKFFASSEGDLATAH